MQSTTDILDSLDKFVADFTQNENARLREQEGYSDDEDIALSARDRKKIENLEQRSAKKEAKPIEQKLAELEDERSYVEKKLEKTINTKKTFPDLSKYFVKVFGLNTKLEKLKLQIWKLNKQMGRIANDDASTIVSETTTERGKTTPLSVESQRDSSSCPCKASP